MLVDLVFQVCWIVINVVHTHVSELFWQVYMLFITWRYLSRLENYTSLKYGTDQSGKVVFLSFLIILEQVY